MVGRKKNDVHGDHYDVAIGVDGRTLPLNPAQVRQTVAKAMAEGTIVAVLYAMPNDGALAFQVFDDNGPSEEVLRMLETLVSAYRKAVEGDTH